MYQSIKALKLYKKDIFFTINIIITLHLVKFIKIFQSLIIIYPLNDTYKYLNICYKYITLNAKLKD